MILLFLGPPGSGKGTHSREISEILNIPQLSTGDMLRAEITKESEIGKEVKNIIESGNLVSDNIMNQIIMSHISLPNVANGFILDGYPRNISQAKDLDEILSSKGTKLTDVIELKVDDNVVVERIVGRFTCKKCGEGYHDKFKRPKIEGVCDKCGGTEFVRRNDDNENVVIDRLKVYHNQTSPLIDYYKSRGILIEVDASTTIENVKQEILKVLNS